MLRLLSMYKGKHTDEELKLVERRNAENWLLMNSLWVKRLRKGAQSRHLRGRRVHTWVRRRLSKGVEFRVLEKYGSGPRSAVWWKLTPYAEMLLMEMEE